MRPVLVLSPTLAVLCLATAVMVVSGRHRSALAEEARPIGVRNAHAMGFDLGQRHVVLHGGADASSVRRDTWVWNGRHWRMLTSDGPGPRTFAAMTFDEARGETVLFGGNRVLFGAGTADPNTLLGDTWTLRGDRWQRRSGSGPKPRAEAAMAYDRRRRRAVLFGGYAITPAGRERLGDTWEWDGDRWYLVASSGPQPRNGGSLAFDEQRKLVVLSGGPPAFVGPETWEWNGQFWHRSAEPFPPGRFNPVMVYHRAMSGLLRFGGWTGEARVADTWIRTDGVWHQVRRPGPSARNHAAMAYDSTRRRAVLFGGHDGDFVFGDTWEFDGIAWRAAERVAPERRVDNKH